MKFGDGFFFIFFILTFVVSYFVARWHRDRSMKKNGQKPSPKPIDRYEPDPDAGVGLYWMLWILIFGGAQLVFVGVMK